MTFEIPDASMMRYVEPPEWEPDYPIYRACPIAIDCGGYYITDKHREPIEFLAEHMVERHDDQLGNFGYRLVRADEASDE